MTTSSSSSKTETVKAAELLSRNYSYIMNVRNPGQSKAYRAMLEQLETAPQDFYLKNSGILIANDRYIINGGHTLHALQTAANEGLPLDDVNVQVTYIEGLSKGKLTELSVSRNTSVSPPAWGIRDVQGAWRQIRKNLPTEYEHLYEFRPNTKPDAPFRVNFLVALLHGVHTEGVDKMYSNKNSLVKYYRDEKYETILPRLGELIELYSFVYKQLLRDKKFMSLESVKPDWEVILPDGSIVKGLIPEGYMWPFYASFAGLWNPKQGVFLYNPKAAFRENLPILLSTFIRHYNRLGRNPNKVGKDKDIYKDLLILMLKKRTV